MENTENVQATPQAEPRSDTAVGSNPLFGTPRTDAADRACRKFDGEDYYPGKLRDLCRQLERELNDMKKKALSQAMPNEKAHLRVGEGKL
jgi:hypothetical protein